MSYFNKATLANFNTYLHSIGTRPHLMELLFNLIERCDNPEVAHEMTCQLYEQPNLARETKLGTLVSFNPLKEHPIVYSYVREEPRWFDSAKRAEEWTTEGWNIALSNKVKEGNYTFLGTYTVKEKRECTVEDWKSATIADEPNEGLMAPDCERCHQGYDDCPCQDKPTETDCFDGDNSQCE